MPHSPVEQNGYIVLVLTLRGRDSTVPVSSVRGDLTQPDMALKLWLVDKGFRSHKIRVDFENGRSQYCSHPGRFGW